MNSLFESILNKIDASNVYNMPKQLSNNNYYTYTNNVGHALIKKIEFKIGGQLIDTEWGEWLNIYNELYDKNENEKEMLGKWDKLPKQQHPVQKKIFIPLKFWFCKDIGYSLPLVSLQYSDIEINIDFRSLKNVIIGSNNEGYNNNYLFMNKSNIRLNRQIDGGGNKIIPNILKYNGSHNIKLWSNVIYLDVDERRRFAQTSHEYLIDQVQKIEKNFNNTIEIPFNNPIKTLYWTIQNKTAISESNDLSNINYFLNGCGDGYLKNNNNISNLNINTKRIVRKTILSPNWNDNNDYFNYNTHSLNNIEYYGNRIIYEHFKKCKIVFNGEDRIQYLPPMYFRDIQYEQNNLRKTNEKIYMYSFSLKPDEYQPFGSCNFSRLDNVELNFEGDLENNYQITIFAENYNILRIMNGMGGLLYA